MLALGTLGIMQTMYQCSVSLPTNFGTSWHQTTHVLGMVGRALQVDPYSTSVLYSSRDPRPWLSRA